MKFIKYKWNIKNVGIWILPFVVYQLGNITLGWLFWSIRIKRL